MRNSRTSHRWQFFAGTLLAAIAFVPTAAARVIYVKWDAAGANDGTSWVNAHVFLQDALAAATSPDEVWVAAGLYKPDQGAGITPGNRNASFALPNSVRLYGGFAGTETELTQRDWLTNVTRLSGDLLGNDGPDFANREDNSKHVVRVNIAGTVDGFEIRSGYASDASTADGHLGGGVLVWNGAACAANNCTIVDNWAHYGGGVGGQGSFWAEGSAFIENRAQYLGGGLRLDRAQVFRCHFERNHAPQAGGAFIGPDYAEFQESTFVQNDDSGLEIANSPTAWAWRCVFAQNAGEGLRASSIAQFWIRDCSFIGNLQGGLHAQTVSEAYVVQSLFSGNTGLDGAAIFAEDSAQFRLANCSLSENSASGRGGGLFLAQTTGTEIVRPALVNSIFWGNRDATGAGETSQVHNATPALIVPSLRYSCITAGWSGDGVGNIAVDPLFVDADGPDGIFGTLDDDLHLRPDSPAIDAGDNFSAADWDFSLYSDFDLDSGERFEDVPEFADTGAGLNPFIDMGPYEQPGRTAYVSHRTIELEPYGFGPVYVSEGGTAEFYVWLSFDPVTPLTLSVTLGAGDPDISVVSGAELTFDSSNWSESQTVILAAAQDPDGGWGKATLDVTGPGLSHYLVEAFEADDEPQELLFGNAPLYVPEGGEAAFTVALAFDPGAPMTFQCQINVGGGDLDLQLRDSTLLVFDSSNYFIPQPVWVVALPDADSSSDWGYVRIFGGLWATVDVYEIDDDHSFIVTDAPVSVPEGGAGTFYVRPEGGFVGTLVVTTAWQSGDADISISAGQTLIFTPEDGGTPQPVTLAAAHDTDDLNGTATLLITAPDWPDAQVIANEIDDDHRLIVSPASVSVPEGSTATFGVRLAVPPASPVTVDTVRVSGDLDVSVVGGAMLSFDATNFDQPQIVTLGAAEDTDRLAGTAQFAIQAATYDDVFVVATEVDDDTIIRVSAGAAPGGHGDSWASAFQHLQDALAVAQSGEQIWVAPGTYKPDQGAGQIPGNRGAAFVLGSGVALYGGFAGIETTLAERSGLFEQTVLSGDLLGNDGPNFANYTDNSEHILVAHGTDVLIDGFRVRGGCGILPGEGGPALDSWWGQFEVRNCHFTENQDQATGPNSLGGAVRMLGNVVGVFTDCTFDYNRGNTDGGAVFANIDSTVTFIRCQFLNNHAGEKGGAVYAGWGSGSLRFVNCLFVANASYDGGVAFFINFGPTEFTNCTLYANGATRGAGVCIWNGSTRIANCIFRSNTAARDPDIREIGDGSASVTYSDIASWSGAGNISADPQFVDPDGADGIIGTVDDDMRLAPISPCIDAGDNTAVPSGITIDLNGDPRFVDSATVPDTGVGPPPIVDMGAYEYPAAWLEFRGLPVRVPEGNAAEFEIRLLAPPALPITVTTSRVAGDPDIDVAVGATLYFDPATFDQWQAVTLAAAHDPDRLIGEAIFDLAAAGYPSALLFATEIELGDVNCDGPIDFFDIDPFLLALFDPAGYAAAYPNCDITLADVDDSGFVDNFDVDPFLAVLFGQ